MKRVAGELAREPRIDVLINNAGALFNKRQETADGLEMTFALNHMAYFVLTQGLSARLTASAPARIVSTASAAHQGARLDFDDLQGARSFSVMGAYGRSKLCNILFTRELARRLAGTGVTANCLHPGVVATRFGSEAGGLLGLMMPLVRRLSISPARGAETIVHLAASPEVEGVSGLYFAKCAPATPSAAARDDAAAARLWEASERLAGAVMA
jgi:NAD(P)-dependent dehydrogenase (short-subunit alcohol dehydrogenase family)